MATKVISGSERVGPQTMAWEPDLFMAKEVIVRSISGNGCNVVIEGGIEDASARFSDHSPDSSCCLISVHLIFPSSVAMYLYSA